LATWNDIAAIGNKASARRRKSQNPCKQSVLAKNDKAKHIAPDANFPKTQSAAGAPVHILMKGKTATRAVK